MLSNVESEYELERKRFERLEFLLEKTRNYSKFTAKAEYIFEEHQSKKQKNDLSDYLVKRKQKQRNTYNNSPVVQENPLLQHEEGIMFSDESGEEEMPNSENISDESFSTEIENNLFVGTLRSYQIEGVNWMLHLYENGLNGILADEMGLGKTIQTIAFLCKLRQKGILGPFLIICPLATVDNWRTEFKRFAPRFPALAYVGTKLERSFLRERRLQTLNTNFPLIITTYEISMRDSKYLKAFRYKYIIVDEGHRLKNPKCKLLEELKHYHSSNRLLLTGTPLQNDLKELWALLHFLLPDIFSDLDIFENWFDHSDLNSKKGLNRVQSEEKEQSVISRLHQVLEPFLLRRLKSEVEANLPRKKEYLLNAKLTKTQIDYYQAILEKRLRMFLIEKGGSTNQIKKEVMNMKLQNSIVQLRKVCNHPYLFDFPYDRRTGLLQIDENIVTSCGKMLLLDQLLLKLLKGNHKVLIFSQMTKMLEILADYLSLRMIKYCIIDGDVEYRNRVHQIKQFNETNSQVFLLSTRAGGQGINLTSADTVIIYDSDWNPQMDLQAQDRVHRIGQTKPVNVYRLVTQKTVETRVIEKASLKRKLEKVVIHENRFDGGDEVVDWTEIKKALMKDDYKKIPISDDKEVLDAEELARVLLRD